jgi:hypothetical protein
MSDKEIEPGGGVGLAVDGLFRCDGPAKDWKAIKE